MVLTTTLVAVPQVSVAIGASNVHCAPHSTTLSWLHAMLGPVVSTTVTVWLHCATLPHELVAFQVRVALKVFPQSVFVTVFATIIATLGPSHRSVAVGVSKVQSAPH